MIYTEYDPLQSVIVGDTYAPGDVDHLLHKGNTSQFNKILEETKQDLDLLSDFLKQGNIEVMRPHIHNYDSVKMPQFDVQLPIAPVVPRDALMVMGKNIICLLYTSPSPRDRQKSRMPSSA